MFSKGDRVRIRRDSRFSNQSDTVGTIVDVDNSWYYSYQVVFYNYKNSYRDKDLELAEKIDFNEVI